MAHSRHCLRREPHAALAPYPHCMLQRSTCCVRSLTAATIDGRPRAAADGATERLLSIRKVCIHVHFFARPLTAVEWSTVIARSRQQLAPQRIPCVQPSAAGRTDSILRSAGGAQRPGSSRPKTAKAREPAKPAPVYVHMELGHTGHRDLIHILATHPCIRRRARARPSRTLPRFINAALECGRQHRNCE